MSRFANGRMPAALAEIEVSQRIGDLTGLGSHEWARVLLRMRGTIVGEVVVKVRDGRCRREDLVTAITNTYTHTILARLIRDAIEQPVQPEPWRVRSLLKTVQRAEPHAELPAMSVVVCTRDRPADLAICLDALSSMKYAGEIECIVVDNAPTTDAVAALVRDRYPDVRYVREDRPGLDWARNRGIVEASHDVIAFTDDDAIVASDWATQIGRRFAEDAQAMAVTGLVVPHELETEAQAMFEMYGGFARGYDRQWVRATGAQDERGRARYYGTGQFGTGANMAFRRELFTRIGGFDPALDVGTVTNGGGDLEIFFRLLHAGYTLVFEPGALVRHRHRSNPKDLKRQIEGWGTGFMAYIARSCAAYPETRGAFARLIGWWLVYWIGPRAFKGLFRRHLYSTALTLIEFRGGLGGLRSLREAQRRAAEIAAVSGPSPLTVEREQKHAPRPLGTRVARSIELTERLQPIVAPEAAAVDITLLWLGRPLFSFAIDNAGDTIGTTELRDRVCRELAASLCAGNRPRGATPRDHLHEALLGVTKPSLSQRPLSAEVPVSIVVATYDRPGDLETCLRSLTAQRTPREVDIVVVDNHAESGLTAPVVARFPEVRYVTERRAGLSYARNAGFTASRGDIAVTTDDDVIVPPDWLERLLAPFSRPDVMVVTGHVLPQELSTKAQQLFETYGGLGRGWEPFDVGTEWIESLRIRPIPTWLLGATANAAFRTDIFRHPEIGLLDEALGTGTPTGCSEDTDLFHKVLRAGYRIAYEPSAYVWHRHRGEMSSLVRQIYSYSKGHVAYQLTVVRRFGEPGALFRLFAQLPFWHLSQLRLWAHGWRDYPLRLILNEIAGNLAGPWALWRSRRRVKRLGRSAPMPPPRGQDAEGAAAGCIEPDGKSNASAASGY